MVKKDEFFTLKKLFLRSAHLSQKEFIFVSPLKHHSRNENTDWKSGRELAVPVGACHLGNIDELVEWNSFIKLAPCEMVLEPSPQTPDRTVAPILPSIADPLNVLLVVPRAQ